MRATLAAFRHALDQGVPPETELIDETELAGRPSLGYVQVSGRYLHLVEPS